jgi:hypothetical protein
MDKITKGWKVLAAISRRSACTRLESHGLIYPVGVEAFPTIPNSKLFFFKTEEAARNFAGENEMVVPCLAKNAVIIKWRSINAPEYRVQFWKCKNRNRFNDRVEVPQGTMVAESNTCLK